MNHRHLTCLALTIGAVVAHSSQATAQTNPGGARYVGPQPTQYGPSLNTGAYLPFYGNGPLTGTFVGPNANYVPYTSPNPSVGGFVSPPTTNSPNRPMMYNNYYPTSPDKQRTARRDPLAPPDTTPSSGPLPSLKPPSINTPAPGLGPNATNIALGGFGGTGMGRAARGRALFTVKLPADATLIVEGVTTKATGASRRFHSPTTLEAGTTYEYTFRAEWPEHGKTIARDKNIRFKTGDDLTVDFASAEKAAEALPTPITPPGATP